MTERFDAAEAERLHDDASALVAEAGHGQTEDNPTRRVIAEEEIRSDPQVEGRFRRTVLRKSAFYRDVGYAWAGFAEGVSQQDMAKVRAAHARVRELALEELSQG